MRVRALIRTVNQLTSAVNKTKYLQTLKNLLALFALKFVPSPCYSYGNISDWVTSGVVKSTTLTSFDRRMRVKRTLVQTLASQLSSSFDQDLALVFETLNGAENEKLF